MGTHNKRPEQPSLGMALMHPCEGVIGPLRPFLSTLLNALHQRGIPRNEVASRLIDHVCYRCATPREYLDVKHKLINPDANIGSLAVEGMIGGRPIATVQLHTPYVFDEWAIPAIELACPKPGRAHMVGLEHVEVVVGQPGDSVLDATAVLTAFRDKYPDVVGWDLKAMGKEINADISLELGEGVGSVKFHARPLLEVVAYEVAHNAVVPVPPDFFDDDHHHAAAAGGQG
jgi:hypothetical protein